LAQTYKNWECIVVDDSSIDYTKHLLEFYSETDPRIKYYSRPPERPKGANTCRNIGFEKSLGDFITWFDSDDLMTPGHIENKLKLIQEKKIDFVVARTQNFQNGKLLEPYHYEKKDYGIKASDFILLKIHWYTYDVMLKRDIAEKISWNEKMKSWQDYNYFCKMLLITENGTYLDKILTHRRIHKDSIQKSLTVDSETFNTELLENRVFTYKDISEKVDTETKKELVFGLMNLCFELSKMRKRSKYILDIVKIVERELGVVSKRYFKTALTTGSILEKGHYFLNKAKQR
jgi:glycosyltransferase involved in cell wall biosynthesis